MIKQSQLPKIKSQILSNLFNEKYGLRLGEFKNTTGTERVNLVLPTIGDVIYFLAEFMILELDKCASILLEVFVNNYAP